MPHHPQRGARARRRGPLGAPVMRVLHVSDDGVPGVLEVDPDLVAPPRVRPGEDLADSRPSVWPSKGWGQQRQRQQGGGIGDV